MTAVSVETGAAPLLQLVGVDQSSVPPPWVKLLPPTPAYTNRAASPVAALIVVLKPDGRLGVVAKVEIAAAEVFFVRKVIESPTVGV